ncbi:hypothetical protein QT969_20795 [Rhodococcus sp. CSLK01-03]|uniref:Uncharacterized protein n=1 Tax=Rhodococcus indonesiensis TaxID=3055869 RepID=A0ABT7RSV4_9NOCA|nr:hypothetical protein [Rhodococcus indonesiensis]MDM7490729.1 hypothetical protein [Rhodococcus indonesiensis]
MGRQHHRLGEQERQARAVELRRQGYTYEEIRVELRYGSRASAWKAVRAVLGRRESTAVEELRALEDERLDALTRRLNDELGKVRVGSDPAAVARLATALLRVSESRRRLHSADEPQRAEVRVGGRDSGALMESLKGEWTELMDSLPSQADLLELKQLRARVRELEAEWQAAAVLSPVRELSGPPGPPDPEPVAVVPEPEGGVPDSHPEPAEMPVDPPRVRCARCTGPLPVGAVDGSVCGGCQRLTSWQSSPSPISLWTT